MTDDTFKERGSQPHLYFWRKAARFHLAGSEVRETERASGPGGATFLPSHPPWARLVGGQTEKVNGQPGGTH